MSFIKSISVRKSNSNRLPFDLPAIKFADNILLHPRITIFIGQNGLGKSTMVESLALKLNLPILTGPIAKDEDFRLAHILQPHLHLSRLSPFRTGFFFRAEDLSPYIQAVETKQKQLYHEYRDMGLKQSVIEEMSFSQNYLLKQMLRSYGNNLQNLSHSQATMAVLKTVIQNNQVLIFDEPENGLYFPFQKEFIKMICDSTKEFDRQIIITTHSSLIASIPESFLYSIENDGIKRMLYQETDHYRILKESLDNLSEPPP